MKHVIHSSKTTPLTEVRWSHGKLHPSSLRSLRMGMPYLPVGDSSCSPSEKEELVSNPSSLTARLCSMMSAPHAPVSSISSACRRAPLASGNDTSRWGMLAICERAVVEPRQDHVRSSSCQHGSRQVKSILPSPLGLEISNQALSRACSREREKAPLPLFPPPTLVIGNHSPVPVS